MSRMRLLAPLAVTATLALALAACGSGDADTTDTTPAQDATPAATTTPQAASGAGLSSQTLAAGETRFRGPGFSFVRVRGTWTDIREKGADRTVIGEYRDTGAGTLITIAGTRVPRGESLRQDVARYRASVRADGQNAPEPVAATLGGEPAFTMSQPSPTTPGTRSVLVMSHRDGDSYAVAFDRIPSGRGASSAVAERAIATWRWR